MSILLKRAGKLQTVTVEAVSGIDAQGKPAYDSAQEIDARVVREDAIVKANDGDEVRTTVTLWIDGAETPLPIENDRVTLDAGAGTACIAVERKDRRTLQDDVLDHVRIRCREE